MSISLMNCCSLLQQQEPKSIEQSRLCLKVKKRHCRKALFTTTKRERVGPLCGHVGGVILEPIKNAHGARGSGKTFRYTNARRCIGSICRGRSACIYWALLARYTPAPLAHNIVCLDYSVAKNGGSLVAYESMVSQLFVPRILSL